MSVRACEPPLHEELPPLFRETELMGHPQLRPGGSGEQAHSVLVWADPAHGPAVWAIFSFAVCIILAQWLFIRHLTKAASI